MNRFYSSILTLALSVCLSPLLNGQVFNMMYNSTVDRTARDIMRTPNGDYLIVGFTNNSDPFDSDLYVMRTDANGQMLWDTVYGGPKPEYAYHMAQTADGLHFIVVGYSQSGGPGDHDIYILKLDALGKKVGERRVNFGGKNDEARQIIRTDDGKFLIIGSTGMNSTSHKSDMVLLHINGDDQLTDASAPKLYGESANHEFGLAIAKASDGNYIIAGQTWSKGAGRGDAYVVKLKSDFTIDWDRTYGDNLDEEVVGLVTNADATAMLAIRDSIHGASADGNINVQLQKISTTDGTAIGSPVDYGGTDKDTPKTIQPVTGGGYIIGAISRSDWMGFPQQWLIKTDANGSDKNNGWIRSYGEIYEHDHAHQFKESHDGGFLMVGHQRQGVMKVVFMKLDGAGLVGINEQEFAANGFALFPNPSSGALNIKFREAGRYEMSVYDLTGRQVFTRACDVEAGGISACDLDTPAGIYIVNVKGGKGNTVTKLVVE